MNLYDDVSCELGFPRTIYNAYKMATSHSDLALTILRSRENPNFYSVIIDLDWTIAEDICRQMIEDLKRQGYDTVTEPNGNDFDVVDEYDPPERLLGLQDCDPIGESVSERQSLRDAGR